MRLLHEYPAGARLYFTRTGTQAPVPEAPCPYPVQLWYDPTAADPTDALPGVVVEPWAPADDGPRKKEAQLLSTPEAGCLLFEALLNGQRTAVLLDTGTGHNWISQRHAEV